VVEVTSLRRLRETHGVILHTSPLLQGHLIEWDGLPVTSVERTLLDVCSVARRWSVEAALDGAIRKKQTTLEKVTELFISEARRGRRGARLMRELLTERGAGQPIRDSDLHREFVRFLKRNGVTGFSEYFPVRDETGFFVEIDVAFPHLMLGFEVDGYSAHSSKQAFERDRERERQLIIRGWTIVRITKADLKKPEALLRDIHALLCA
jgi:hypothetical protein